MFVAILEQVINDYEQVGEMLEDSSDHPENIYENITDEPTYENIYEKVMKMFMYVVIYTLYLSTINSYCKIYYLNTLRIYHIQMVLE